MTQGSLIGEIFMVVAGLQWLGAVAAVLAAWFWYRAALLSVPDFSIIGTYSPSADKIAPISEWARASANLNKLAAGFFAIAASAAAAALIGQAIVS
jgi:hypothetical protein